MINSILMIIIIIIEMIKIAMIKNQAKRIQSADTNVERPLSERLRDHGA